MLEPPEDEASRSHGSSGLRFRSGGPVAAGFLLLLVTLNTQESVSVPSIIRMSARSLSERAVKPWRIPEYPPQCIRAKHSGIVVADVLFNPTGTVSNVQVLESTDEDMRRSVQETLGTWRIKPPRVHGQPVAVISRCVFHFRGAKKAWVVLDGASGRLAEFRNGSQRARNHPVRDAGKERACSPCSGGTKSPTTPSRRLL